MSEPLRVLEIEDSESDAALIVRLLEKGGYEVHCQRVEEAVAMRAALEEAEWDVVIADYHLPQFDAPAALRILHETGMDIPFIVVSARMGEDVAVEMMKSGAHDYVMKNNLARLVPAVEREIREARSRRERRKAEAALQQQIELVNFSHDAVIAADENRVIRTWNTGAEEIYGWTEAEAVGQVMHKFFHTGASVSIADIDRVLAREGRWDGELVHRRKDGQQIIVESRQILRRNAAGAPIGILEINRDIRERKRLEDQLRQAQKLEGIGRLAGAVAHDFNNLLTVISGFASTVMEDLALQHPLREPMEQISKAAARATSLTRQLLIFSRRRVSETKNIVLNDLVRDFEKMLRRLIGEDIDLVLLLDPDAGLIRADAGQIEQVILNLAVNAKDAMPKGGTLSIETSRLRVDEEYAQTHFSVQPGVYVVLTVSDTGVGMSPEVKSHLFEPFFTTKEPGKGTGLGLSTVYGIVKQSEGSIWVYSEPGRGTAFRMLFPAVEAEREPLLPAPVKGSSGDETILLAEDEPDVRAFLRRTLERQGYTVLEASNGREALEVARQHTGPIHLVMADVVMPEMGGAELAEKFGAEHPNVPVLFMSGYTNGLARERTMGAGYLQKPFTPASLLTRVRTVLDSAKLRRAN